MNNFKDRGFKKREGGFGNKSKFGGKKPFGHGRHDGGFGGHNRGGFDRGPKEMYPATCSTCGRSCEVPFRPNGERPVFCKECFGKNSSDERGGGRTEFRPQQGPRTERAEYGRHSEPVRQDQNTDLTDVIRRLSTIENRLNRILDIINPPQPTPEVATVSLSEVVAAALPAKKVAKAKVAPAKKAAAKKPAKKAKK